MKLPDSCYYCAGCIKGNPDNAFENRSRREYNPGLIGKNYENSRIMFILNRSDSRALETIDSKVGFFDIKPEEAYVRALRLSDTGRVLKWLNSYCGISMDDLYITNAFKCLMPDDREPMKRDYEHCANILRRQIRKAKPRKILVYGSKPKDVVKGLITTKNSTYPLIGDIPVMFVAHPRKLHDLKIHDRQKEFVEVRNFLQE